MLGITLKNLKIFPSLNSFYLKSKKKLEIIGDEIFIANYLMQVRRTKQACV